HRRPARAGARHRALGAECALESRHRRSRLRYRDGPRDAERHGQGTPRLGRGGRALSRRRSRRQRGRQLAACAAGEAPRGDLPGLSEERMSGTDQSSRLPQCEPALRAIAMPADANPSGDIFGGWVLSQMDLAGGTVATRRARGRVATVAITGMTFYLPVFIGDEVSCYGEIVKIGRSSITV